MITKVILTVAAVAALTCVASCSGPASTGPVPAPATTTSAAATTSAASVACSNLFETGQRVTTELTSVVCQEPNGLSGVNHKVVCKDGSLMVFDSALGVYGFPGGVFAAQDTSVGSAYSRDYAKCNAGSR